MPMEEMTADEFRQHLDSLLNEDFFPPIGITRNGERRMVVVPVDVYRSLRGSPRLVELDDNARERLIKEIMDQKIDHLPE
jgi:prevent-host-death family protein